MQENMDLLHEKIDRLTVVIEMQNERLAVLEASPADAPAFTDKLDFLVAQAEAQARQREELNELKRDVAPIANQMIKISIDELSEIGSEFRSEDLLFLLKRALRDTEMLVEGLNRLEMMMELYDEVQFLGQGIFNQAVSKMDEMERQGYFEFARSGWGILERVVTEFSQDDVDALADNVVAILTTVKNLTQPEIMAMTNNALQAFQTAPPVDEDISMWALLRDLRDPQVRRGMARMLNMVKMLADPPMEKEE